MAHWDGQVKLWDVSHGLSTSVVDVHILIHSGTLLQDMVFKKPYAAFFFNHSPTKLIVACHGDIFIADVSTLSTQPFSSIPQSSYYSPHALALSKDDAVLMAGCVITKSVCGYDTASRARLWIHNTANSVRAVCMLGARLLVTVSFNPTLVLDIKSGSHIASLQKADGDIFGLGVIDSLFFILSFLPHPSDLHTSVYIAMLQHLLYKQAKPLRLPLEMWDWIAKYRV